MGMMPKEPRPQVLLFSATMPHWVASVAKQMLSPSHVVVDLVGNGRVNQGATKVLLTLPCLLSFILSSLLVLFFRFFVHKRRVGPALQKTFGSFSFSCYLLPLFSLLFPLLPYLPHSSLFSSS